MNGMVGFVVGPVLPIEEHRIHGTAKVMQLHKRRYEH